MDETLKAVLDVLSRPPDAIDNEIGHRWKKVHYDIFWALNDSGVASAQQTADEGVKKIIRDFYEFKDDTTS